MRRTHCWSGGVVGALVLAILGGAVSLLLNCSRSSSTNHDTDISAAGFQEPVTAVVEDTLVTETRRYAALLRLAQDAWEAGRFQEALAQLDQLDKRQRGWEHVFLKRLCEKHVGTGHEFSLLQQHTSYVDNFAFSPDGKCVVSSAAGRFLADKKWIPCEVKIWDLAAGRETLTIPQNSWFVRVAFSPDSKRLVVGGDDGTVAVWDAISGKRVISVEPFDKAPDAPRIREAFYLPDGKGLICRDGRGRVKMLDASTGKTVRDIGRYEDIDLLALSPDGKWLVAGGHTKRMMVLDASTGTETKLFKEPRNRLPIDHLFRHPFLNCAVFSQDGNWLATGSGRGDGYYSNGPRGHAKEGPGQGTVLIWNTRTGENVLAIESLPLPIHSLGISPEGKRLAGADSKTVTLWDMRTGIQVFQLKAATDHLAFSSDGRRLACAERDRVKLFDVLPAQ